MAQYSLHRRRTMAKPFHVHITTNGRFTLDELIERSGVGRDTLYSRIHTFRIKNPGQVLDYDLITRGIEKSKSRANTPTRTRTMKKKNTLSQTPQWRERAKIFQQCGIGIYL